MQDILDLIEWGCNKMQEFYYSYMNRRTQREIDRQMRLEENYRRIEERKNREIQRIYERYNQQKSAIDRENSEEWNQYREEARERVNLDIETDIQGFDIDAAAIKAARANAKMAGVDRLIHFQQRPVSELRHSKPFGFIVTNPPYGERIEEKSNLPALYREIGESYKGLDRWSMYLITAYDKAENDIGRKADKNRKIYNGMMKTYYYQFLGPRPPKKGSIKE